MRHSFQLNNGQLQTFTYSLSEPDPDLEADRDLDPDFDLEGDLDADLDRDGDLL